MMERRPAFSEIFEYVCERSVVATVAYLLGEVIHTFEPRKRFRRHKGRGRFFLDKTHDRRAEVSNRFKEPVIWTGQIGRTAEVACFRHKVKSHNVAFASLFRAFDLRILDRIINRE